MTRTAPRVLLTNDDAGPNSTNSPFIYPFSIALKAQLGWDVRVVCPAKQQSWKGKSYNIQDVVHGYYMTPTLDGAEGERRELPNGSKDEWIMIDGTPSTCSNMGLHSLFEENYFDLVIAGPNYGRNTSSAFALSSGTIGAALAAALSGVPAIALSFGLMTGHKPTPAQEIAENITNSLDRPAEAIVAAGISQSCKIIEQLWESGFNTPGQADAPGQAVDVYTINVPLEPSLLAFGGAKIEWTTLAKTSYQRLFKSIGKPTIPVAEPVVDGAGPAAIEDTIGENGTGSTGLKEIHETAPLKFVFSPDITSLIDPNEAALAPGSDTHCLHSGAISVTPIMAAFQAAPAPAFRWKL